MNFMGKGILIVGASGGIGKEMINLFLEKGAHLLLCAQDVSNLKQYENIANVQPVGANLLTEKGRHSLINAIKDFRPGITVVIYAAGLNEFTWLEDQEECSITRIINLNLQVPILLTKQILTILPKTSSSMLVYLGSTMGTIGLAGSSTYCASKFGLRGFVQALRRELHDSSIQCLYIAPRGTHTNMNGHAVKALNTALKYKMDEPSWVAKQIVFSMEHEKVETYLGWPEKLFVKLNGLLPILVDKILSSKLSIFKKYAKGDYYV